MSRGMYPSEPRSEHGAHTGLEPLEPRVLMSASPFAAPDGDGDDQIVEAIDLGGLTEARGHTDAIGTNIDVDMYSFTVTAGQRVMFDIDRPSGALDSYIRLFTSNGVQLASNDDGAAADEDHTYESLLEYTFANAGTYYLGVSGYGNSSYFAVSGASDSPGSQGAYELVVTPTLDTSDDGYEENDAAWRATHFGTARNRRAFWGLKMADTADWYRFRTTTTGTVADYVRITFDDDQGDLDFELYNGARQLISRSQGIADVEEISLAGQAPGNFFIRVYGYAGAQNAYNLIIEPFGTASPRGDDIYEDNDTRVTAKNLGLINTEKTVSNLVMGDGHDWFRFTMNGVGTGDDFVRIDFSHARGDLDLELYNAQGQLIDKSVTINDFERISLERLSAGEYYVHAFGFDGAVNPNYSLNIDVASGSTPPVIGDDTYEHNDTRATAYDFGALTETLAIEGLVMADASDFYKFSIAGVGNADHFVRVSFDHNQGDLDLSLLNAAGTPLRSSLGTTGTEQISLDGLAPGTYVVRVYGYNAARNPGYSLTVAPPGATEPPPAGRNILYVNFDGMNISHQHLRNWAGDDWQGSIDSYLDPEGDGLRVPAFLPTRGDRNQIINGIIARLTVDLAPFGVTVQRTRGGAVRNQGATTLFFGRHNMRDAYHVAGDIDYGNDNNTDIAFVGDEDSWGSAANTITALSDVALHEAGHTFGLFHVNVMQRRSLYPETMGLRYTVEQSLWLRDTGFLNRRFPEYLNHGGGRGSQNAYQTMRQNFGLANGNPVATKTQVPFKFTLAALLACTKPGHPGHDHGHHEDHDDGGHEEVVDAIALAGRRVNDTGGVGRRVG